MPGTACKGCCANSSRGSHRVPGCPSHHVARQFNHTGSPGRLRNEPHCHFESQGFTRCQLNASLCESTVGTPPRSQSSFAYTLVGFPFLLHIQRYLPIQITPTSPNPPIRAAYKAACPMQGLGASCLPWALVGTQVMPVSGLLQRGRQVTGRQSSAWFLAGSWRAWSPAAICKY